MHRHKSKKRKSDSSGSTANGQTKKSKNSEVSSGVLTKNMSRSSGQALQLNSSGAWPAAGGDDYTQCSYLDEQDSIKQLADIALRADRMEGRYLFVALGRVPRLVSNNIWSEFNTCLFLRYILN